MLNGDRLMLNDYRKVHPPKMDNHQEKNNREIERDEKKRTKQCVGEKKRSSDF
jgi:hypothetical protein